MRSYVTDTERDILLLLYKDYRVAPRHKEKIVIHIYAYIQMLSFYKTPKDSLAII